MNRKDQVYISTNQLNYHNARDGKLLSLHDPHQAYTLSQATRI